MKSIKIKSIISLIMNFATAALTAAAVGWFFTDSGLLSGAGNMKSGGTGCFSFFTVDSNIIAALSALCIIPFNVKSLTSGKNEIPKWTLILKFIGAVAVTVTFTVVLFFLGPILGYKEMFEGNCFHLHLTCPLLTIISFCFFEYDAAISKKTSILGILPTAVYGTVYLINVIFTKVWSDFYHFNIGGFWYISYIAMLAVTYLFAYILLAIHNKMNSLSDFRNTNIP